MKTLDGNTVTLSKLQGHPLLINFWASWCTPCRAEMPEIVRVYEAHQADGLVVLAINMTFQDSLPEAQAFVKEFHMPFPVLLDDTGAVARDAYRLPVLPMSFFIDRKGVIVHRQIGAMNDKQLDTFTINGKAFPATAPLTVRHGERVRLRLINASNMQTFVLRLAGHRFQVTHTDGNPLQQAVEVDILPIVPAERYDVTFVGDHPGQWPLYALNQPHTQGGLKTLVVYEGSESAPEAALPALTPGLRVWSYSLGQGVDRLPQPGGRGATYQLTLSGGMMMSGDPNVWTINGKVYPQTDPLVAERNQLVSVRLSNMSMQTHLFHLHGQSFRVLRVGGQTLSAPLIKDTVDVPAMMGTVDLEIIAFNPGDWMFHCHKPMHMDGGMATLVKVG